MQLGRELLLSIAILVLFNLLLAFGATGLLVRMGPAIDRILQENLYSVAATEEILVELARADGQLISAASSKKIEAALKRARQNVTEADEKPVLARLRKHLAPMLAGELDARARFIEATQELSEINRRAVKTADADARRLGNAGAWAAVFVGVTSLILSIMLIVRVQRRFVEPLVELHQVLEDTKDGNALRRCGTRDAPVEILKVAASVNRLLDERIGAAGRTPN